MSPKPYTNTSFGIQSCLTLRSVLIGILLAIFIAIWTPHTNYVMHGPRLTLSHISIAALISFLFVVFCLQIPLRIWRPQKAFTAGELSAIFFFCLVSSTIPGKAFVDYFLSILASPYYYASPENRWVESFFPYLPGWLVVGDSQGAATGFYEGTGYTGNLWISWIIPLFWWFFMLAALFLVMACISVIFRRHWVENERLTFPGVQIPIMLIAETTRGNRIPSFMKDRYFQIGFILTFSVFVWNCMSYFGSLPPIPIGSNFRTKIQLMTSIPPTEVQFNIFMMCFAFFADLKVLMSIWVFHLLALIQISLLNQLGVTASGFWIFVLWGIWVARHHLKLVWLKAVGRPTSLDDSMEIMSYRGAIFGVIGGLCYLLFWLRSMGMDFDIAAILILITIVLYIGVTRIVAETGLIFLDLPVNSNEMTVAIIGSRNISPQNLTALGLTHTFSHNHRGLGFSALVHGLKTIDQFIQPKKLLFLSVCLVLILTFLVTNGYTVYTGMMGTGAHDFGPLRADGFYNQLVTWLNNPFKLSYEEIYFLFIGGLITGILLSLHYKFPTWPLHPIGFTIAYTDIINYEITSIFIIWLIKSLLMRFGGFELYRKMHPSVVGVLLGYAAGVSISLLVDVLWFPGQGHNVHNW